MTKQPITKKLNVPADVVWVLWFGLLISSRSLKMPHQWELVRGAINDGLDGMEKDLQST